MTPTAGNAAVGTVNGRIGILALGNLMRTDDAVGMLALHRLLVDGRLPSGVVMIEGGTLGLDLLGRMDGITHLVVLDAVDFGAEPGTLRSFNGDEIRTLPTSKSVHLLGFADLLKVLQLMDAPAMEVILFGAQPEITDWGTELTPKVEVALCRLVEAVVLQVARWSNELVSDLRHSEDPLLGLQHWPAIA